MPGSGLATTVDLLGPAYAASFNSRTAGTATNDAIPSSPIASSNDGILLYTDRDLNENVRGAVLQKYGQGQVTEVIDCDVSYKVKNGKYDLFVNNGINIVAGQPDNPANINITAQGHYTEKALGDRFTTIFGVSHSEFIGESTTFYMGDRSITFIGHETQLKMSTSHYVIIGEDDYFRLGGRFQFTLSSDRTYIFGKQFTQVVGTKTDIVVGMEIKFNVNDTWKMVFDRDDSFKNRDYKIIYKQDIVVCPGTSLSVKNDVITFCNYMVTNERASVENSEYKQKKADIETVINKNFSQSTDATKMEQAAIHLFL